MIQILGLRTYTTKHQINENGQPQTKEVVRIKESLFDKQWRAPSVRDLFLKIEKYIEAIPPVERMNLFYTAGLCKEERGRKLIAQNIIPYDIDGIDTDRIEEYIEPVLYAIGGLNREDVAIVATGNGLQFIVGTTTPIKDVKYFNQTRVFYKTICLAINKELQKMGLPGDADSAVWSPARLLRLPMTENIKTPETGYPKKQSIKKTTLITRIITNLDYDIEKVAGVPQVQKEDYLSSESLSKFPKPDSQYVLKECGFLQYCNTNQESLSEEDWYKMLSITSRLENGYELSHNMSQYHPQYTEAECSLKIEQAKKSSGPRTCENIKETFGGCSKCEHNVISPILLKGKDFIATREQGFRNVKITKDGRRVPGSVNFDDLVKYFEQEHTYVCTEEKFLYVYNGKNWDYMSDQHLHVFAEQNIEPKPKHLECNEFVNKIYRNNIVSKEWFSNTTFRKINLNNGVLHLDGDAPVFTPHSYEYGFLNTLQYDYNPKAESPIFDKFMSDITSNQDELTQVLLEYAAYAIANEDCTRAKALLLLGDGANGKSTFMHVLQELVGENGYSCVPNDALKDPQFLAMLQGKLFNLAEETPKKAFLESSTFKDLVAGGNMSIKKVYKEPYMVKNRCKLIMACNELPASTDMTCGFLRRLIIVPFDQDFSGREDYNIENKIRPELSGVLNHIIDAYQRLKKCGKFTDTNIIDNQLKSYREENDPIKMFVDECIDITDQDDHYIYSEDLYRAFKYYTDDSGYKVYDNKAILIRKIKKLLEKCENVKSVQKGKLRLRAISGILLTNQQQASYS